MQNSNFICKECGVLAMTNRTTRPGNVIWEAILYIFTLAGFLVFVVPGILFLIFAIRYTLKCNRGTACYCESCGAQNSMLPLSSPLGNQIATQIGHQV